ncbi:helix-turn-helix domain-containing protein [Rhodococcus opacus]|nr:helix-turn-helix domain-containing protein [Rhodococcus opacus]MDT2009435.1 helix-turn-helix domain-containing protein [Rhodococcus opacus]MDT2009460.1 helix-turn-helix domain-containing protein [Rhodococcus opacus]
MVTVEVDSVRVESRLSAGEIGCPCCPGGVLGGWGHARSRPVAGVAERVRPRRARCRSCSVTHVLLPVSLLLRRAYLAEWVFSALLAKARGAGHRPIASWLGVPTSTVRGWLRRFGGRFEAVRAWFLGIAMTAGVDVRIPKASGSGWVDALAAIGAATKSITTRFGPVGILGVVTAAGVAAAGSSGRLLAPGWPPGPGRCAATPVGPDDPGSDRQSSRT